MEPWLDSLSDDWKSEHHSSSPAPSIASQQKLSRIGSITSQSRIPHLAQNIRKESTSTFLRPRSTRGLARSRTEPVLAERSASSLNVPPPKDGSQKLLTISTLPRRASGALSNSLNSVQHHTVHERLSDVDTPEWKRRLANGENIASDGLDLFAPSKLEGMFKEPATKFDKDGESSLIDSFSKPWKPLDLSSAPSLNEQYLSLRTSRSKPPGMAILEEVDEETLDKLDFSAISSDVVRGGSIRGIVQKRVQSLERVHQTDSTQQSPISSRPTSAGLDSANDPRWRTVSGRKELGDEFISPVTASRQDTIRENAVKDSLDLDMETLDQKLAQIGVSHHHRPSSSSSDRQVSYSRKQGSKHVFDRVEDVGDITSQSLPDDLSMGTQDFISQGGFINRRRGGASNEASFLRRGLSSTDQSHLGTRVNQVLPSSPPLYLPKTELPTRGHRDSLLQPSTPQEESIVHHESPNRPTSSGSPLKLFGNRDTYTNNKLMRILSHFDVSGHSAEEQQEEAPDAPEQNELRMSRFGEGELSNFDFDFKKPISPVDSRAQREPAAKIFVKQLQPEPTVLTSDVPLEGAVPGERQAAVPLTPLRSPKRRRTLLKGEILVDQQQLEVMVAQVQDLNQLAGTKRKDARPGDAGLQAEPEVLASRALLLPRMGRKSSTTNVQQTNAEAAGTTNDAERNIKVTEALAAKLDSFVQEAAEIQNDSRKPSLATKDYMEEANKVMEFIRSKGRPKPKLADIKEPSDLSELDPDELLDVEIDDESTKEEFSRPPSRERPVRPLPDRRHAVHDPRTASYLRKYKDDDDLELLANTSGPGTLRVADNREAEEASQVPVPEESIPEEQESSPPNMRILNANHGQKKRKHSASTLEEQKDAALQQLLTHNSDSSTRQTFPTSSSTGNRGMIESGTVSIPDQVGKMAFDHQRKVWVQAEDSVKGKQEHARKDRPSTTDEDPFANIPDLSIGEQREDERATRSLGTPRESELEQGQLSRKSRTKSQHVSKSEFNSGCTVDLSGQTRSLQDRAEDQGHTDSSLRSEISKHEARLHDGLTSKVPCLASAEKRQARAVTIAFSSPLVSAVKYPDEAYLSDNDLLDEEIDLPLDDSEESLLPRSHRKPTSNICPIEETPSDKERGDRYGHYRAMTLNRRPVSRIDEKGEDEPQVEMSLVHVKRSLELTPAPHDQKTMVKARHIKNHNSSILCLTPLSEFSLHQIDLAKHPEESFVEERANLKALRQAHGSQALSVDALIKAITDAAPGVIYWEQLRTLKLGGQSLTSLHGVNEYCPRLEELSVTGNQIAHLNGLPTSLRTLDFEQNVLTSFASWGALRNLQYVNVSKNQLESLDGFSSLVHLRKLVANDNHIKNIDGVLDLDGLLELDVRGNGLIDIDFADCGLSRLSRLDVSNNKLRSIRNLDHLAMLKELDVSDNHLSMLPEKHGMPESLRVLTATNNDMETLDFTKYPGLRSILLDGNKIRTVTGLESAYDLECVSFRAQRAVSELVSSVLSVSNECRKIYLSLNLVPGGRFKLPALPQCNLRELELSGCGISELPPNFGDLFPNCRQLNLNFNGIGDISNLRGMHKLSELHVARNRVKRMRRTCLLISRLQNLTRLDLRDNPLTSGFYPPQHARTDGTDTRPEEYYNSLQWCGEKDRSWVGLLDETTKLKRRTIELLLANRCSNLKALDGGEFIREAIQKTDQTWDILTREGVLVKPLPASAQELDTGNELGLHAKREIGAEPTD